MAARPVRNVPPSRKARSSTAGSGMGGSTRAPLIRLSAAQARRIAVAAQGLAEPPPSGPVTTRTIRRLLDRLAVVQIDSVNVVCRSHYLPVLARLGPYSRELLDAVTGFTAGPVQRETFEYWAHEASILPLAVHPLLRWRMARAADDAWGRMRALARQRPDVIDDIRRLINERGPVRAADSGHRLPPGPRKMWSWHQGKVALEYLFWTGEITAARRVNFERRYDFTERVLPEAIVRLPTPDVEEAQRHLLRIAARAHGVATEADLGDYFRLPRAESKARTAELVDAGELEPVHIDGWPPAYLWPGARHPRRVDARALLSPFDSLIWHRPRTERLFGMRYRLEIYLPPPLRVHGYYVLPFLLDDNLVARVDLKAERQTGTLSVRAAHAEPAISEPGPARRRVVAELIEALAELAGWLQLDQLAAVPAGDLGAELAAATPGRLRARR